MDVNQVKLIDKEEKKIEEDREGSEEICDIIKRIAPDIELSDVKLKSEIEETVLTLLKENNVNFKDLPKYIQEIFIFSHFPLDDDKKTVTKPDWLDMDKFKKGQIFFRENLAAIFLTQLYGLLSLFCHEDGLKTLILTKKSHTPYEALRRYTSTGERIRNWITEDPWTEGTKANKDIHIVRRMHLAVRRKIVELDYDEIDSISAIHNPYCPALPIIKEDFGNSVCPTSLEYRMYNYWFSDYLKRPKNINQIDTSFTLFGFMGFALLYPNDFGIYTKSDEDLENFCHFWKSIAYLLGVHDEANFCRGTLEEVKQRCRDYIKYCLRPSFATIHPDYEHMSRCVFQGYSYVMIIPTFEMCLLHIAELIDIKTPNLYASLSYIDRIRDRIRRFLLRYGLRYAIIRKWANGYLQRILDKVSNFDEAKQEEIKEKSLKTMLHVSVGT